MPYVIGFDTMAHYVPDTLILMRDGVNFLSFMSLAPFIYVLLMGVTSLGVPIVISLKVLSPLLLGLLGSVTYFYANRALSWSPKKSLLVALFATLYFVALRVSFDMLRSELGLIFLFVTMILLKKDENPLRNSFLLSAAMLLVVFAHQLVAVLMFAVITATVIRSFLNKDWAESRRLFLCSTPALFLFAIVVYSSVISSQIFVASDLLGRDSAGFLALFGSTSHLDLVLGTLGFLAFCYLPLLPLLVLGFRRFKGNLQLKVWIIWIFFSLSLVIISQKTFFSVHPYRWTLLLTYPLAFYAAEALSGLKPKLLKIGVGLMLATLSLGFLLMPPEKPFFYFSQEVVNGYIYQVPSSILQNTVSIADCQDTGNALQWLKTKMDSSARLLTHRAFYGWALTTLNDSQVVLYEYNNPNDAAKIVAQQKIAHIYLIWWINGQGWYGQSTVQPSFEKVYQSGRIAIYRYAPANATSNKNT